jgi:GT2 family glycosyltransferase
MTLSVNVMVLNYNGRALLEKYLPSLEAAVARSRHRCVLTVVENPGSDDSVAFLRSRYPKVAVHEAAVNRVLCSYNEAAAAASEDIVLFMNNDIRVDENFIDPLVEPFLKDPDVFMVTPRCLSMKDNSYEGNRTRARLRYGVFWSSSIYPGYEEGSKAAGATFQGGFGAFDRKKFLELEGYDDLYLPGRLEDADICFRAYQKGWKCLYEPASVVYHEGGTSFHKEFGVQKTLVINWRNTFLFMWKNFDDKVSILQQVLWLPARLLGSILTGKPELFLGFCAAVPMWGRARSRRRKLKRAGLLGRRSDRSVLEVV